MLEQMKRARASEEGFTLIELLVVVAILAILAGVVVFAVQGISDKGQTSACKIDTRTMRTVEEGYFASPSAGNGNYGTMVQLVPTFLSEPSTLHNVTPNNGATPKTYSLTEASSTCGVSGNTVGQTATDF